ncbi:N-acetylglucosamine-6-phosphate deacetylase [Paenibacillaceae bacterium]|nr:N-acetylglucosamine-6-phosphate deacetylase [Paenibacillaceae bacterium]
MNQAYSTWRIHNVNIVAEDQLLQGTVTVENGIITAITEQDAELPPSAADDSAEQVIDGKGGYLLPGFIDLHIHGGYGGDFMDASVQSYDAITKFHAQHGTTAMLATTVTAPFEQIEAVLAAVAQYRSQPMPYAELLGVHLEGPFISTKWAGAQNPAHMVSPQLDWLKQWVANWPGLIKQLTLAPETAGAFETIRYLADQGIIAAAGHTDASYDTIVEAVQHGLSQAVHTFNAMTPLHHREPGTAGAVLTIDDIAAELIADGLHVHPAAIRLLTRAKNRDKLILITDAMAAAGLGEGQYMLGDLAVIVKGDEARLAEGNSLAGSTLTMIGAFRYVLSNTELSIPQVSQLASGNPAKQLGIEEHTGSIAIGKRADLLWTDSSFQVQHTWVNGQSVFSQ